MTTSPRYVGIDLGTTNSAAAVFDGDTVTLVRNAQGGTLTPSIVRIDGRGNLLVGSRARRYLESDPDNTRLEFKRLMGTSQEVEFPASGQRRTPEALSAEILKSLRADIQEQFGFVPDYAVISVPALFELPQSAATSEAARLAGFRRVELLQEPIASALAHSPSSSIANTETSSLPALTTNSQRCAGSMITALWSPRPDPVPRPPVSNSPAGDSLPFAARSNTSTELPSGALLIV